MAQSFRQLVVEAEQGFFLILARPGERTKVERTRAERTLAQGRALRLLLLAAAIVPTNRLHYLNRCKH